MKRDSAFAPSAVQRTLLLLREDAERLEDGTLIGSENELLARYGVSRPTLRQAAALVAQEQLVRVRRGVSGGYFAARPTAGAAANMAAIYLRSRATGIAEMMHAAELVRRDMVRLAAESQDGETKAELALWLEQNEANPAGDGDLEGFRHAERAYSRFLDRLSGNNVLALFLDILLELLAMPRSDGPTTFERPERRALATEGRGRIIRAIGAGDAEVAVQEADRMARQIADWVAEDRAAEVRVYRPGRKIVGSV